MNENGNNNTLRPTTPLRKNYSPARRRRVLSHESKHSNESSPSIVVNILRADDLPAVDKQTGLSNPFCAIYFCSSDDNIISSQQSTICPSTISPTWKQEFTFSFPASENLVAFIQNAFISIVVKDKLIDLGLSSISLQDLAGYKNQRLLPKWHPLQSLDERSNNVGRIYYSVRLRGCSSLEKKSLKIEIPKTVENKDTDVVVQKSPLRSPLRSPLKKNAVVDTAAPCAQVSILSGRFFYHKNVLVEIVSASSDKKRTLPVCRNKEGVLVWNESYTIPITDNSSSTIAIRIRTADTKSSKTLMLSSVIGEIILPVPNEFSVSPVWVQLTDPNTNQGIQAQLKLFMSFSNVSQSSSATTSTSTSSSDLCIPPTVNNDSGNAVLTIHKVDVNSDEKNDSLYWFISSGKSTTSVLKNGEDITTKVGSSNSVNLILAKVYKSASSGGNVTLIKDVGTLSVSESFSQGWFDLLPSLEDCSTTTTAAEVCLSLSATLSATASTSNKKSKLNIDKLLLMIERLGDRDTCDSALNYLKNVISTAASEESSSMDSETIRVLVASLVSPKNIVSRKSAKKSVLDLLSLIIQTSSSATTEETLSLIINYVMKIIASKEGQSNVLVAACATVFASLCMKEVSDDTFVLRLSKPLWSVLSYQNGSSVGAAACLSAMINPPFNSSDGITEVRLVTDTIKVREEDIRSLCATLQIPEVLGFEIRDNVVVWKNLSSPRAYGLYVAFKKSSSSTSFPSNWSVEIDNNFSSDDNTNISKLSTSAIKGFIEQLLVGHLTSKNSDLEGPFFVAIALSLTATSDCKGAAWTSEFITEYVSISLNVLKTKKTKWKTKRNVITFLSNLMRLLLSVDSTPSHDIVSMVHEALVIGSSDVISKVRNDARRTLAEFCEKFKETLDAITAEEVLMKSSSVDLLQRVPVARDEDAELEEEELDEQVHEHEQEPYEHVEHDEQVHEQEEFGQPKKEQQWNAVRNDVFKRRSTLAELRKLDSIEPFSGISLHDLRASKSADVLAHNNSKLRGTIRAAQKFSKKKNIGKSKENGLASASVAAINKFRKHKKECSSSSLASVSSTVAAINKFKKLNETSTTSLASVSSTVAAANKLRRHQQPETISSKSGLSHNWSKATSLARTLTNQSNGFEEEHSVAAKAFEAAIRTAVSENRFDHAFRLALRANDNNLLSRLMAVATPVPVVNELSRATINVLLSTLCIIPVDEFDPLLWLPWTTVALKTATLDPRVDVAFKRRLFNLASRPDDVGLSAARIYTQLIRK